MQDNIKIFFNNDSEFSELDISVNSISVDYERTGEYLEISIPQHPGVNILRVKLKNSSEKFIVTNVKVNDVNLRMSLYLSYVEENNIKRQPDTAITDNNQTWILPYGSPVSFWLSLIAKKFKNSEFGTNLYDTYNIYYPEPIKISDSFPRLIVDYFDYDFDFTVVNKHTATFNDIPYLSLLKTVDTREVYAEIMENLDYFYSNKGQAGQLEYNKIDNAGLDHNHWSVWWFGRGGRNYLDDVAEFPKLKKFLLDLDIQGPWATGLLAFTKPGSFSAPHIDDTFFKHEHYHNISGCACMYIPISPDIATANIKMAGVGALPHQPLVINNDSFVHGVYNDSNRLRVYMSLRISPTLNSHLFTKS